MEYLGIVWFTSWLVEFFSSSNNLLTAAEYLGNQSAANVLFVANNSDRKLRHQKTQLSDRRKPDDRSLASVNVNFDRSWIESFLHSLRSQQSANREFCPQSEQITGETQLSSLLPVLVSPTYSTNSARLTSQKTALDYPTQTMLEWVENIVNIVPLSGTGPSDELQISSRYPAVQVVRVHPENFESELTESMYQIWVRGCSIGEMPHPISAYAIAFQLQNLLSDPSFDPQQIEAKMIDGQPGVQAGSQLLFVVDDKLAEQLDRHPKVIALQWVNNLRQALDTPPLTLAETQAQMYGLEESGEIITGLASWYGPYFHGRLTANGETYNQYDLTAAHPSLPFDTYLKVTNLNNGLEAIVRINDRGPYIPPRSLDLSLGAARQLGSEHTGVIEYEATIMKPGTQIKRRGDRNVTKL